GELGTAVQVDRGGVRVIAGSLKGRKLDPPDWEGLRPTSDKLRETLFNILAPRIVGARVLDGYAGTGAIGIEALSRGAAHVTFVERDPRAVQLIETNLAALGLERRRAPASDAAARKKGYAIIRAGFADAAKRLAVGEFDLLILDPPYADRAAEDALAAAVPLAGPDT